MHYLLQLAVMFLCNHWPKCTLYMQSCILYSVDRMQHRSACYICHSNQDTSLKLPLLPGLQCTDRLAVQGFIQHVTNRSETEIIIIGADCSVASQPVASQAPFWNLVQVKHKYISIHFSVFSS